MPSMNSKLLLQIWLEQVNLQIPVSILNVKPGLCQSLVSLLVLHEYQFSIKSLKHSQGAPAKVCRMSFAQFLPQYLSRLLLLLRSVKSYPYTSSDDIGFPGKQMTFTQLVEFPFFHCPHQLRIVLSLQSVFFHCPHHLRTVLSLQSIFVSLPPLQALQALPLTHRLYNISAP